MTDNSEVYVKPAMWKLVWFECDSEGWHLCIPGKLTHHDAPYSAWPHGDAESHQECGAGRDRFVPCPSDNDIEDDEAAVYRIAVWAREDGYKVPHHPLGWNVGDDPTSGRE